MTISQESDELDERCFAAIRSYVAEHGYPPTLAEIGVITGHTSRATVKRRVARLVDRGWVTTAGPGVPRSIVVVRTDGKTETEDL